ncbi:MAG TPA: DUF362 domain-containing protein [Terriglobia bacterium]|nr:DUF362 domain-containing protein [Terriglobia bacterium]
MVSNGHIPLARISFLERTGASVPAVSDLAGEIGRRLSGLNIPFEKLRGRRIAVTVGSRGVASLKEIVRAICDWLKNQGARPFAFPAMGSHGGATAEGQRQLLAEYGVTPEFIGAEILSSMETVPLGSTPEGFQAFMDRNAYEADSILVVNRVKPHTDFSGNIESGVVKMMTIGLGKADGATEAHRCSWKHGFETAIRAISTKVLATGKILCGIALIENELHQIAEVRAARPEGIFAQDEEALKTARQLVPRIPFPEIDLLIVDEMGKNISGTGMDTKVIGRGVEPVPPEAPRIRAIYTRDLTPETEGNAAGVGLADLIHDRLYRKIDYQKTFINVRISLNLPLAQIPMHAPSDRDALDFALGYLGSPPPEEQRLVWIRNTLSLDRIAISETLARASAGLKGWRLSTGARVPEFDPAGDLSSPF